MTWLTLFLIAGCSKQEPCDSAEFICDTAAYHERQQQKKADPPDTTTGTWIESIQQPGCAGQDDTFIVGARVRGPTNGQARVDIWAHESAGGFNEAHPLATLQAGTGFEDVGVELNDQANGQQYMPGLRTTYVCGETDTNPVLTFAIRVYDTTGTLADCALFSTENYPDEAIAEVLASQRPEPNEVADRGELTADACSTWSLANAG